jgi:hypothetical protein
MTGIVEVRRFCGASLIVAAVLAAQVPAAKALTITGSTTHDFSFINVPGDNGTAHDAAGSVLFSLDNPGMAVQLNVDFEEPSLSGVNASIWAFDGDVFWRDSKGTFGVSVDYDSVVGTTGVLGDTGSSITFYGAYGEWYATSNVTLQFKTGAYSAGGTSNVFVDGGARYYLMPNAALDAQAGYLALPGINLTSFGAGAQYMLSRWPVSLRLGYNYASGGGAHISAVMLDLAFRIGHVGGENSLRDYDRRGPITWDATLSPNLFLH